MGRIAATQIIATIFVSALSLILGRDAAYSAALAGIVCIVPSLYVWLVSRRPVSKGSTGMGIVIRSELGKYALLGSLMAIVFVFYRQLNVAAFFATLVILQICALAVPLVAANRLLKK